MSFSFMSLRSKKRVGISDVNSSNWNYDEYKNIHKPNIKSAFTKSRNQISSSDVINNHYSQIDKNIKDDYIKKVARGVNPAVDIVRPTQYSGFQNNPFKVDADKVVSEHVSALDTLPSGKKKRKTTSVSLLLNKQAHAPSLNNDETRVFKSSKLKDTLHNNYTLNAKIPYNPQFVSKTIAKQHTKPDKKMLKKRIMAKKHLERSKRIDIVMINRTLQRLKTQKFKTMSTYLGKDGNHGYSQRIKTVLNDKHQNISMSSKKKEAVRKVKHALEDYKSEHSRIKIEGRSGFKKQTKDGDIDMSEHRITDDRIQISYLSGKELNNKHDKRMLKNLLIRLKALQKIKGESGKRDFTRDGEIGLSNFENTKDIMYIEANSGKSEYTQDGDLGLHNLETTKELIHLNVDSGKTEYTQDGELGLHNLETTKDLIYVDADSGKKDYTQDGELGLHNLETTKELIHVDADSGKKDYTQDGETNINRQNLNRNTFNIEADAGEKRLAKQIEINKLQNKVVNNNLKIQNVEARGQRGRQESQVTDFSNTVKNNTRTRPKRNMSQEPLRYGVIREDDPTTYSFRNVSL